MPQVKRRTWMSVGVGVTSMMLLGLVYLTRADPSSAGEQKPRPQGGVPIFEPDGVWPKVPSNWMLGQNGGIHVDAQDHIWVLHRPRTVPKNDLKTPNPPFTDCCAPAPPVLEFDAAGNFIQGWGGPGAGFEWPEIEHGIYVDHRGNVWIAGSASKSGEYRSGAASADSQILKFTKSGKFLLQIGRAGANKGSNDTENVGRATAMVVSPKTNELFVADGYGNRRVIVFDAETGKYMRHWSAYGNKPDDAASYDISFDGPPPQQFNTPHAIALSNDDLLYVGDRGNKRIQVFNPNGTFVKEGFVARSTPGNSTAGTTGGLAFSPDKQQQFLYVADSTNNIVQIVNRQTLEIVGKAGRYGRFAGQSLSLHTLAADSKGNIYTGDTVGMRVQRLLFKGLSSTTSSQ